MRIAIVLPGRGRSGGVRATVVMGNKLIARGHEVRILYPVPSPTLRTAYRAIRTTLVYRGRSDWLPDFKGGVERFSHIEKCMFHKGEIIVGAGMWASLELAKLSFVKNPKVQYIHGNTPWDPGLAEKALGLPLPKLVVASYLETIVRRIGRGEVLAVVPNGVDTEEYYVSGDDPARDGVGTIYSSHPAKDPVTSIAVLRELRRARPECPIRAFGTERAPREPLGLHYWRCPSVKKVRAIYSQCSVWVIASKSEGFPLPTLEAMACGCAVVATHCGGTADIIQNGVNGFLVPVGQTKALVAKVELLLDDEKLRLRICGNAKGAVHQFSWDAAAEICERALARLSGESAERVRGDRK